MGPVQWFEGTLAFSGGEHPLVDGGSIWLAQFRWQTWEDGFAHSLTTLWGDVFKEAPLLHLKFEAASWMAAHGIYLGVKFSVSSMKYRLLTGVQFKDLSVWKTHWGYGPLMNPQREDRELSWLPQSISRHLRVRDGDLENALLRPHSLLGYTFNML